MKRVIALTWRSLTSALISLTFCEANAGANQMRTCEQLFVPAGESQSQNVTSQELPVTTLIGKDGFDFANFYERAVHYQQWNYESWWMDASSVKEANGVVAALLQERLIEFGLPAPCYFKLTLTLRRSNGDRKSDEIRHLDVEWTRMKFSEPLEFIGALTAAGFRIVSGRARYVQIPDWRPGMPNTPADVFHILHTVAQTPPDVIEQRNKIRLSRVLGNRYTD